MNTTDSTPPIELPDIAEGDAIAARLADKSAPEVVRLVAMALRQGLAFAGLTAVVAHRNSPFARHQRAELKAAKRSYATAINAAPAIAQALREAADDEAANVPASERLYGHYRTIAAQLAEPCAVGCVRVLVCLEATTRLFDVALDAGPTPDPAKLEAFAEKLEAKRRALVSGG